MSVQNINVLNDILNLKTKKISNTDLENLKLYLFYYGVSFSKVEDKTNINSNTTSNDNIDIDIDINAIFDYVILYAEYVEKK